MILLLGQGGDTQGAEETSVHLLPSGRHAVWSRIGFSRRCFTARTLDGCPFLIYWRCWDFKIKIGLSSWCSPTLWVQYLVNSQDRQQMGGEFSLLQVILLGSHSIVRFVVKLIKTWSWRLVSSPQLGDLLWKPLSPSLTISLLNSRILTHWCQCLRRIKAQRRCVLKVNGLPA